MEKGLRIMNLLEHKQKGQHSEENSIPHHPSKAKADKGRTWLRINRPKSVLDDSYDGVEGGKRKSVWEIDKNSNEGMHGMDRVNKKQCMETDMQDVMEDDQVMSVAGPTERALGCQ